MVAWPADIVLCLHTVRASATLAAQLRYQTRVRVLSSQRRGHSLRRRGCRKTSFALRCRAPAVAVLPSQFCQVVKPEVEQRCMAAWSPECRGERRVSGFEPPPQHRVGRRAHERLACKDVVAAHTRW